MTDQVRCGLYSYGGYFVWVTGGPQVTPQDDLVVVYTILSLGPSPERHMKRFEAEYEAFVEKAELLFDSTDHHGHERLGVGLARPSEEVTRDAITSFLRDELGGSLPEFHLDQDDKNGWAFWLLPADTTSYVHADLTIEWYGTCWRAT